MPSSPDNLRQKTLPSALRKSLTGKLFMGWTTTDPEHRHDFSGIVVHIAPGFIAYAIFEDFEYDGIKILPATAITTSKFDKRYKVHTEILNQNGHIRKAKAPAWLTRCQTLPDVLTQLNNRDIWPGLDLIDGSDTWFFLGQLTHVEEDGILIRSYSNTGRWFAPQGLRMQDIHVVHFDRPYARHFNNYMRRLPATTPRK